MNTLKIRSLLGIISIFCIVNNAQADRYLPFMQVKIGERGWSGSPLNRLFLQKLQQLFSIDTFIETGTYLGDSSAQACQIFKEVHTIELSPMLYEQACNRFAHNNGVKVYCGDSTHILPEILSTKKGSKLLLWLDGHWSCGNTAHGDLNTPILQELRALKNSGITDSIILIDDIRLFQKALKNIEKTSYEDYPELPVLIKEIKQINNEYICLVYGDTLLAFTDKNITVSPLICALTISRINQDPYAALESAEDCIINCNPTEKALLSSLCDDFVNDEGYGFSRYFHFWKALTLIKQEPSKAQQHFIQAFNAGCLRAYRYL